MTVVVVLTLTRRYNAVRGHRTGSNNCGVPEDDRVKIVERPLRPKHRICPSMSFHVRA